MQLAVQQSALLAELALLSGVAETKTTIPVLSNIYVEASGDRIHLIATNLELGLRCSMPAEVKRAGSSTMPAKRLMNYVRLLPDAEISCDTAANHWSTFKCGKSKTKMAGITSESFPEVPETPETAARIPVSQLCGLISLVTFAITSEESRFTLVGALMVIHDNVLTMVATDGHRLSFVNASAELPEPAPDFRCLVPKSAMGELLKLAKGMDASAMVELAFDANHLFFTLNSRTLISRKLTGNFPDYERVLPRFDASEVLVNRDELKDALSRVIQFSDERSRAVRFTFTEGTLTLASSTSETGESEESMEVPYSGPPVEIGVNANYVLDILRACPDDTVAVRFKDPTSAVEFRPSGGISPEFRYIVMPMRI